jgi:hypothetical protein
MKKGDEKMNENEIMIVEQDELNTIVSLVNEVIIEEIIAHELIDDNVEPDEIEEFACNAARELLRE